MKTQLSKWLHTHPVKAVVFAMFFTFMGCYCAYFDHVKWTVGIPLIAAAFVLFEVLLWRDLKKLTAVGLVLAMAFGAVAQEVPGLIEQAPKEELEAAAIPGTCIVAGAVVVGGLFACYLIARLCKKVFPAPPAPEIGTNGIPGLVAAGEFAPDTDAACFVDQPLYEGSCFSECGDSEGALNAAAVDNRPWTVVQVDIAIGESEFGPTARVLASRPTTTATATTDLAGFQKGLARWGLHFDPSTPGQAWAHNGQPVPANGSPIQLNIRPTGTVPVISRSGIAYPAVIERSEDLQRWEFLTRAEIEPGLRLRIVDTTPSSQMFYRLRVRTP